MWENYFSLFFNSFFLDLYLTYQKKRIFRQWSLFWYWWKYIGCCLYLFFGFFFLSSKTAFLASAKLSPEYRLNYPKKCDIIQTICILTKSDIKVIIKTPKTIEWEKLIQLSELPLRYWVARLKIEFSCRSKCRCCHDKKTFITQWMEVEWSPYVLHM